MAISANTVYRTVLLILNNEQRGYMTPDEFNKIGSQVQRQIFEAYFEDLNQQLRIPQSDMDYSNRVAITDEKIAEFKTENVQANPVDEKTITGANPFTVPSELYRLGSFTYEPAGSTPVEIQRLTRGEYYNINKSPLTTPSTSFPIYLYEDNKTIVYPSTITSADNIKMQYLKKPSEVRWGYYTGGLGQYINDPTIFGLNLLNTGDGTLTSSILTNPTGITTDQTYTNLSTTVSPAGGSGAILSAVVSGGTVTSVSVTTAGSGYSVDDTLTVSQAQLAGGNSNLDIILTAADFNSGSTYGTTNFELHNSERTEVILKILLYSGIVIRDPSIIQVAAQKIQQEEVNEKS